jgi:hypothetical protein
MDVREMHIEVNQATQSIAANARRKFYPDEIDWILNKMVTRYIGTHVGNLREQPGAADSLVHLNRLSTLLDKIDLLAYQTEDGVSAVLPFKVSEVLSIEPHVHNLCGATAYTFREEVPLVVLQIKETTAVTQWYKDVVLNINGEAKFSMQTYATKRGVTFNGFQSKTEQWRLIPLILTELAYLGYQVHWETYGDVYIPDSIIFSELPGASVNITIDSVVTSATVQTVYKTRYINEPTVLYPGRLYFQSRLPGTRRGAFSSTYYRSPLAYLANDKIEVDLNSSFIVGKIRVHHVRRPRKIDINLGDNCELPEGVHPDICDLATEYIKVLRADPDWELKLRDNMTRTTI